MIAELADRAAEGRRLAIDTEFVSERRYQALLCLMQVAVPDASAEGGVRTEVLDPLEGNPDFSPLARVLADPAAKSRIVPEVLSLARTAREKQAGGRALTGAESLALRYLDAVEKMQRSTVKREGRH